MNFARSDFGSDTAGAHNAPARYGFKNSEQACRDQNQSGPPQNITRHNNARDQAERADNAARHTTVAVEIGFEEPAHKEKLAHRVPKTTVSRLETLA
jgi:hypothetical protein